MLAQIIDGMKLALKENEYLTDELYWTLKCKMTTRKLKKIGFEDEEIDAHLRGELRKWLEAQE